MKLTIPLATRGRPALLLETVGHIALNMGRDDTRLLICVDDDDIPTLDCLTKLPTDDRISVSIKPREDSRGEKYDRALKEARADIYLPAVDYAPILTPGFDQAIVNAAWLWDDGYGVVYTPMVDEIIPGLQAITAKMADKLGCIYSHEYPFWFVDHEIADIACMIARVNFADVHVDFSRRPQKTHRLRELEFWTYYYEWLTDERIAKAHSIINAPDFDAPQKLKAQLRDWHPWVTARSLVRNTNVRADASRIERDRGAGGPPDEGYVRIKERAKTKLLALAERLQQEEMQAA